MLLRLRGEEAVWHQPPIRPAPRTDVKVGDGRSIRLHCTANPSFHACLDGLEVVRSARPSHAHALLPCARDEETLADVLDRLQPGVAARELDEWCAWASRSKLKPFVKLARTVRKHLDGILAYLRTGLTNGLVEGLNNKIRLITRRAYGFHGSGALAAMIYLCCGGITLEPPLPLPTATA